MAIVLVEDHDDLRNLVTMALREEGFEVTPLSSAEDIDDAPEIRPAEAYIIDLNLPGEDGISLIKRIRASEPAAFVIITTARTEIHQRVIGYASGADVYLPKPVSPDELIALLRSRIARQHKVAKSGLQITLDVEHQLLSGPAGQVGLNPYETRALSAFACANKHTLERWQVASLFSQNNEDISPDNLQMRISRLRKKINAAGGERNAIRAKRMLGYKLTVEILIV